MLGYFSKHSLNLFRHSITNIGYGHFVSNIIFIEFTNKIRRILYLAIVNFGDNIPFHNPSLSGWTILLELLNRRWIEMRKKQGWKR